MVIISEGTNSKELLEMIKQRRAEPTFAHPEISPLLEKWGLRDEFVPMVFVCLGYIDGPYPKGKARNEGRSLYIPKA